MNAEMLRAMLAEQMTNLRAGSADPKQVNAMVNAAGKIISSVKLELEYARMIGVTPVIPFISQRDKGALAPLPKRSLKKAA